MAERITSRKNETVRFAAKLGQSASLRRESGLFLAEGARLCADAALSGVRIREVYFTDRAACMCEKRTREGMKSLPRAHCLALETVQDPGNLGAALRTAEALGIGSVLLAGECCDVYAPKVLRASMGAVFRLPVFFCESLPETLPELSAQGFSSCAAVPDADAVPVTRADFSRPCVMAVGNEGNGLSPETIAACDTRVTIPMLGRAESLNAASSAAILMWEMMREGGARRGG